MKSSKQRKGNRKIVFIGVALFFILLVIIFALGVHSKQQSKKVKKPLTNLRLLNTDDPVLTDKNGNFTLKMKSTSTAKISVYRENQDTLSDSGKPYPVKKVSTNEYQSTIHLSPEQNQISIDVNAKSKNHKKTSTSFDLSNNSDAAKAFENGQSSRASSESVAESLATKKALDEISSNKKAYSESSESSKNNATQSTTTGGYKKVGLEKFVMNPDKYESTNIQTTGTVTYIQQIPDEDGMDFVVIVPAESYTGHGIASQYGTVAQIETDTIKSKGIGKGSTITVYGSGLTDAVKLKGHTLSSSIIVDKVSN
ncbi:lipoprotein precursor [Secundilactobacillus pentosiphilus]|uniref:Lipoprotein n=1 Tax=Secundilactobacillus pentosiphilus TaxID=1714682 RepID=A0A1Z5IUH3_9LACO|nr:hypothetical protein [Secundilactobacillus pentosiphilus]GAX05403.1 lipoprotein precursor [Secundilactobacillus pentosiphilus]